MKAETQIQISPKIEYIDFDSDPKAGRYVFTYTITIVNQGPVGARLLSRHWIITDANGKIEEVRGEGVIGETPYLKPGETYAYTSAAMIATPAGMMEGEYQMITDEGILFEAEIPPFMLTSSGKSLH